MPGIASVKKNWVLITVTISIVVTFFVFKCDKCQECEHYEASVNNSFDPIRETPLIFVGGEPRSGTSLMRAMLDAHTDISCGLETLIIPMLLRVHHLYFVSKTNVDHLLATGLRPDVVDNAFAKIFGEMITRQGATAARYCNKDPQTMQFATFLIRLFPNSKFIFMMRDGRATVHSIIKNDINVHKYDRTDYRQSMGRWNKNVEFMVDQCSLIGINHCLMVYYEQLVLRPKEVMYKVLKFLDVPWSDDVLRHEQFIDQPNGVPLSDFEYSSDQIRQPIYTSALTAWVGKLPVDVLQDMAELAPMLSKLGYDPNLNPPDYNQLTI